MMDTDATDAAWHQRQLEERRQLEEWQQLLNQDPAYTQWLSQTAPPTEKERNHEISSEGGRGLCPRPIR